MRFLFIYYIFISEIIHGFRRFIMKMNVLPTSSTFDISKLHFKSPPTKNFLISNERKKYTESLLCLIEKTSNPSVISDCIWSLGYVGHNLNQDSFEIISEKIQMISVITNNVEMKQLTEIDIAKLFWGLAKLKYNANSDILISLFESSIESLNVRSFSNVLWSLSKMNITKKDFSKLLRRKIFKTIFKLSNNLEMNDQALSMIISSLHTFQYSWHQ